MGEDGGREIYRQRDGGAGGKKYYELREMERAILWQHIPNYYANKCMHVWMYIDERWNKMIMKHTVHMINDLNYHVKANLITFNNTTIRISVRVRVRVGIGLLTLLLLFTHNV